MSKWANVGRPMIDEHASESPFINQRRGETIHLAGAIGAHQTRRAVVVALASVGLVQSRESSGGGERWGKTLALSRARAKLESALASHLFSAKCLPLLLLLLLWPQSYRVVLLQLCPFNATRWALNI